MAIWRLRLLPYVCLAGGVILTAGTFFEWRAEARLVAEGELARGTVVDRAVKRGFKGSRTYVLDVTFQSVDGKSYRKEFKVSRSVFESNEDSVAVRYLPSDPARSKIGAGAVKPGEMLGVGIILTVLGAIWLALRRRRRSEPAVERTVEQEDSPWETIPAEPAGFLEVSLTNRERREFGVLGDPKARLILDVGTFVAGVELDFRDRPDDVEGWDTLQCRTRIADAHGTLWQCEALFLADELLGIDSEREEMCTLRDAPPVRLSEAPPEWIQAFELDTVVSGVKIFRDDRTYCTLSLSGTDLEIPIKYFAPRVDVVLLREEAGAVFLVKVQGILDGDGEEVLPFVYSIDCTQLLFRTTATLDADEGLWAVSDSRPVEFEKLATDEATQAQLLFRLEGK